MKKVIKYQTYDGLEYDTYNDALHHLDVVYGKIISRIAAQIIKAEKYVNIQDYIDSNLHLFQELITIKGDLNVTDNE